MRKLLVCLVLISLLAGCSQPSELHKSMETMGDAFKAMRKEPSLEMFSKELPAFTEALSIAKAQAVKPEHQERFDEGMKEIETVLTSFQIAVSTGDLEQATDALKKLGDTRKKFHEELGVK